MCSACERKAYSEVGLPSALEWVCMFVFEPSDFMAAVSCCFEIPLRGPLCFPESEWCAFFHWWNWGVKHYLYNLHLCQKCQDTLPPKVWWSFYFSPGRVWLFHYQNGFLSWVILLRKRVNVELTFFKYSICADAAEVDPILRLNHSVSANSGHFMFQPHQ